MSMLCALPTVARVRFDGHAASEGAGFEDRVRSHLAELACDWFGSVLSKEGTTTSCVLMVTWHSRRWRRDVDWRQALTLGVDTECIAELEIVPSATSVQCQLFEHSVATHGGRRFGTAPSRSLGPQLHSGELISGA